MPLIELKPCNEGNRKGSAGMCMYICMHVCIMYLCLCMYVCTYV